MRVRRKKGNEVRVVGGETGELFKTTERLDTRPIGSPQRFSREIYGEERV